MENKTTILKQSLIYLKLVLTNVFNQKRVTVHFDTTIKISVIVSKSN